MPWLLLSILTLFYTFLRCHWRGKGLHWPGDICAPSISEHWTLVRACLHISPRLINFTWDFFSFFFICWNAIIITKIYVYHSVYLWILRDLHDFFVGELVTSHFCLVCFRNISAWPNEARAASEENTPQIAPLNGTGLAQSKLGLRFLRTTRPNRVDYSTVILNCRPQKVPTPAILDGNSQASREVAGRSHKTAM